MLVMRKGLAQTSFARKFLAYQETWRQGLHKAHFGTPNFRVLTVTGKERVKHLLETCRNLTGGMRFFLFADQARLSGEDILTQQWENCRGEMGCLLLENRLRNTASVIPDTRF